MDKEELQSLIDFWENIEVTVNEIVKNPAYYSLLMEIALYSTNPKSWRAAYMVDQIHEKHPELILPFIGKIAEQLKVEKSNSKKRHFLKQISLNVIPEKYRGFLVNYCLAVFTSDNEDIAVRIHAMQILFNISETEPELKPEILAVIESEMEFHHTAGLLSRGRKLAQKLRKQIQK